MTETTEIWKDIVGYETFYQVSNTGKVRRIPTTVLRSDGQERKIKQTVLKPRPTNKGYYILQLCKHGEVKAFSVHRLVALTFLDNPKHLPDVNHVDCNKLNNCVDNLEWVSKRDNTLHALANNLMPCVKTFEYGSVTHPKLLEAKRLLNTGLSARKVAQELGMCRNTLKKYGIS